MRGHDLWGSKETEGERAASGLGHFPAPFSGRMFQHCHLTASRENCPGDWCARTRGEIPLSPKTPQPCLLSADLSEVHLAQGGNALHWSSSFQGFPLRWRKVFRNALHADRLRRQHGPAPERAGVGEPSLHTVALCTRCWSPKAAHSKFSNYAHFTAWKWIVMTFLKIKIKNQSPCDFINVCICLGYFKPVCSSETIIQMKTMRNHSKPVYMKVSGPHD